MAPGFRHRDRTGPLASSGHVPLGAVAVSAAIAHYFEDNTLSSGLTYGSHPLACAAGFATLQVYREDGLIENATRLGPILGQRLEDLKRRHPSVGDVRYIGLFSAIELVKNRETKEPLPSSAVAKFLREQGLFTFLPSNLIFVTPPLCITEAQLDEGLVLIDRALDIADQACDG